jgi:Tfp pilus assembly protein PilX
MRLATISPLRRLHGEDGIALPVVMGVMSVLLLLIVVAASDAGKANDSANDDRRSTRALQAADSGIEAAVYALNTLDVTNQPVASKCAGVNASGQILRQAYAAGGTWCPPVNGTLADGTTYRYWVSSEVTVGSGIARTIVAEGTDRGTVRRAAMQLNGARTTTPLFGTGTIISLLDFVIGGNTRVFGNVQSNGIIRLDGSAQICGNATPGPGKTATWTGGASYQCGGSLAPAAGPVTLPPVDLAPAANNDNARICASSNPATSDPCSEAVDWKVKWKPTQRLLDVQGDSHITLGGNVYFFCFFRVTNGAKVIVAPRNPATPVRIYIDDPANCPTTPNPKGTFEVINNGKVENPYGAPALQFYVAGNRANPAASAQIEFANSGDIYMPLLVYAPNSPARVSGAVQLDGAIAARQVKIEGSGRVDAHPDARDVVVESGATSMLQPGIYRECTVAGATASNPAAGC